MKNFSNTDEIQLALSAYVDGELDFADRRKVEELIQSDSTYAQEVEELRLIKRWLQEMPAPAPRRSFTLDPQTAPRPRRLVFPTLRWATAIAAVLLMLTLSADVIGSMGGGFGGSAGGATSAVAPAASGSTASGASESAARSAGAASASGSGATAQNLPDTAAQEVAPSASAAVSVSAAASAGAAASTATEQSSGASADGAYPVPSNSFAATTMASASTYPSASGGADASIIAAPSLADTGTTAPDTVDTLLAANQQSTPVNTLRIAQIVLLVATVALGAGAWFAKRRNI